MATTTSQTRGRLGPTPAGERQRLVDVLRGLALLGILVVNMEIFSAPLTEGWSFGDGIDRIAHWCVIAFFQGKFYLLFSLLFGYGLALQMSRATVAGSELRPRYQRRMIALLVIGLLHAVFLFSGDILVTYAVLGLLLFALRDRSDRRMLFLGGAIFAFGIVVLTTILAAGALAGDGGALPDPAVAQTAYADGSFGDIIGQRLRDLGLVAGFLPFVQWPGTMAAFLIGTVAGRRGLLARPAEKLALYRRGLFWGLPIGLGGGALAATVVVRDGDALGVALAFALQVTTAPALSLAYACALALVFARFPSARLWALPESAGRASLSIYLGQSILAGLVFLSYGLGLFGELGPAVTTPLAVAIWAVLALAAHRWFARYRYGPAEWLLRWATYGRRPPLRAEAA